MERTAADQEKEADANVNVDPHEEKPLVDEREVSNTEKSSPSINVRYQAERIRCRRRSVSSGCSQVVTSRSQNYYASSKNGDADADTAVPKRLIAAASDESSDTSKSPSSSLPTADLASKAPPPPPPIRATNLAPPIDAKKGCPTTNRNSDSSSTEEKDKQIPQVASSSASSLSPTSSLKSSSSSSRKNKLASIGRRLQKKKLDGSGGGGRLDNFPSLQQEHKTTVATAAATITTTIHEKNHKLTASRLDNDIVLDAGASGKATTTTTTKLPNHHTPTDVQDIIEPTRGGTSSVACTSSSSACSSVLTARSRSALKQRMIRQQQQPQPRRSSSASAVAKLQNANQGGQQHDDDNDARSRRRDGVESCAAVRQAMRSNTVSPAAAAKQQNGRRRAEETDTIQPRGDEEEHCGDGRECNTNTNLKSCRTELTPCRQRGVSSLLSSYPSLNPPSRTTNLSSSSPPQLDIVSRTDKRQSGHSIKTALKSESNKESVLTSQIGLSSPQPNTPHVKKHVKKDHPSSASLSSLNNKKCLKLNASPPDRVTVLSSQVITPKMKKEQRVGLSSTPEKSSSVAFVPSQRVSTNATLCSSEEDSTKQMSTTPLLISRDGRKLCKEESAAASSSNSVGGRGVLAQETTALSPTSGSNVWTLPFAEGLALTVSLGITRDLSSSPSLSLRAKEKIKMTKRCAEPTLSRESASVVSSRGDVSDPSPRSITQALSSSKGLIAAAVNSNKESSTKQAEPKRSAGGGGLTAPTTRGLSSSPSNRRTTGSSDGFTIVGSLSPSRRQRFDAWNAKRRASSAPKQRFCLLSTTNTGTTGVRPSSLSMSPRISTNKPRKRTEAIPKQRLSLDASAVASPSCHNSHLQFQVESKLSSCSAPSLQPLKGASKLSSSVNQCFSPSSSRPTLQQRSQEFEDLSKLGKPNIEPSSTSTVDAALTDEMQLDNHQRQHGSLIKISPTQDSDVPTNSSRKEPLMPQGELTSSYVAADAQNTYEEVVAGDPDTISSENIQHHKNDSGGTLAALALNSPSTLTLTSVGSGDDATTEDIFEKILQEVMEEVGQKEVQYHQHQQESPQQRDVDQERLLLELSRHKKSTRRSRPKLDPDGDHVEDLIELNSSLSSSRSYSYDSGQYFKGRLDSDECDTTMSSSEITQTSSSNLNSHSLDSAESMQPIVKSNDAMSDVSVAKNMVPSRSLQSLHEDEPLPSVVHSTTDHVKRSSGATNEYISGSDEDSVVEAAKAMGVFPPPPPPPGQKKKRRKKKKHSSTKSNRVRSSSSLTRDNSLLPPSPHNSAMRKIKRPETETGSPRSTRSSGGSIEGSRRFSC